MSYGLPEQPRRRGGIGKLIFPAILFFGALMFFRSLTAPRTNTRSRKVCLNPKERQPDNPCHRDRPKALLIRPVAVSGRWRTLTATMLQTVPPRLQNQTKPKMANGRSKKSMARRQKKNLGSDFPNSSIALVLGNFYLRGDFSTEFTLTLTV